jgi:DNA-binding LytR/AlgR family response regulator
MEVWIIEDEQPAARRIQSLLADSSLNIDVTASYTSVADTVKALQAHQPDLMVMDIHLADGNSLHIFGQTVVQCPVIFTTAFDQYALEAFKLNSIDYLLKPVKPDELKAAIHKYHRLYSKPAPSLPWEALLKSMSAGVKNYKLRFAVKYGEHLRSIETSSAAYFYTESKATYLVTQDANRYIVDYNMDALESLLDPRRFFRINRQFIIAVDAIADMQSWSKARVFIKLNPACKIDTIVSSERAAAFKQWIDDAYIP